MPQNANIVGFLLYERFFGVFHAIRNISDMMYGLNLAFLKILHFWRIAIVKIFTVFTENHSFEMLIGVFLQLSGKQFSPLTLQRSVLVSSV